MERASSFQLGLSAQLLQEEVSWSVRRVIYSTLVALLPREGSHGAAYATRLARLLREGDSWSERQPSSTCFALGVSWSVRSVIKHGFVCTVAS